MRTGLRHSWGTCSPWATAAENEQNAHAGCSAASVRSTRRAFVRLSGLADGSMRQKRPGYGSATSPATLRLRSAWYSARSLARSSLATRSASSKRSSRSPYRFMCAPMRIGCSEGPFSSMPRLPGNACRPRETASPAVPLRRRWSHTHPTANRKVRTGSRPWRVPALTGIETVQVRDGVKAAVRADSNSPEASAITEKPQVRFVDVARRVNLPALFPLAGDRTHPRFRFRLRDDGAPLPSPVPVARRWRASATSPSFARLSRAWTLLFRLQALSVKQMRPCTRLSRPYALSARQRRPCTRLFHGAAGGGCAADSGDEGRGGRPANSGDASRGGCSGRAVPQAGDRRSPVPHRRHDVDKR